MYRICFSFNLFTIHSLKLETVSGLKLDLLNLSYFNILLTKRGQKSAHFAFKLFSEQQDLKFSNYLGLIKVVQKEFDRRCSCKMILYSFVLVKLFIISSYT